MTAEWLPVAATVELVPAEEVPDDAAASTGRLLGSTGS
jgi:hypothetical protein